MSSAEDAEKIAGYPPAEIIFKMITYKQHHKLNCLEDYTGYVRAFEQAFDILLEFVDALNYEPKSHWPKHRGAQYVFFPGTLETLYRGFDDWSEGFYSEATILNRTVFESIFKIIYISLYPEDYEGIFAKRRLTKGRAFNLTSVMKDDLAIDWGGIWGLGSTIAHGKTHRVLFHICDSSRGIKRPVEMELKYDKTAITIPMNQTILLAWCLIRLLLFLFPEVMTSAGIEDEGKDRLNTVERYLRESLLNMPNIFKSYVPDFEKVERRLKAKEQGLDWKTVL